MKWVFSTGHISLIVMLFLSACTIRNGNRIKLSTTTETGIESRIRATSSFDTTSNTLTVQLSVSENNKGTEIRYFLNGDMENAFSYEKPLEFQASTPGMAMIYFEENPVPGTEVYFYKNKATGKHVEILTQIWPDKKGQSGRQSFTDGLLANPDQDDENWVAFYGVPAGIKVDLGKVIAIEEICIRFLQDIENRIFLPLEIHFSISLDDEEWIAHNSFLNNESQEGSPVNLKEFSVPGHKQKAQFIKIEAKGIGLCPGWHPAKDRATYLFCDEVVVE